MAFEGTFWLLQQATMSNALIWLVAAVAAFFFWIMTLVESLVCWWFNSCYNKKKTTWIRCSLNLIFSYFLGCSWSFNLKSVSLLLVCFTLHFAETFAAGYFCKVHGKDIIRASTAKWGGLRTATLPSWEGNVWKTAWMDYEDYESRRCTSPRWVCPGDFLPGYGLLPCTHGHDVWGGVISYCMMVSSVCWFLVHWGQGTRCLASSILL